MATGPAAATAARTPVAPGPTTAAAASASQAPAAEAPEPGDPGSESLFPARPAEPAGPSLTERAGELAEAHWPWALAVLLAPVLIGLGMWGWHRRHYDASGLPRGPRL